MKNARIAVVDDDQALCSALVGLVRSVGYRGEPFFSAEALLASADLLKFDCIICDVRLPGISGLNMLVELRNRNCKTPVILMTAMTDSKLNDEAISVGAECLLRKPFATQVLFDWIDRIVSNDRPIH